MAVTTPNNPKTKSQAPPDLFDDSTMTFGEHLEALRIHLFKAIIGLVLATCVTLIFGQRLIQIINEPLIEALQSAGLEASGLENANDLDFWNWLMVQIGRREPAPNPEPQPAPESDALQVSLRPSQLINAFHQAAPDVYPEVTPPKNETPITLTFHAEEFAEWREASQRTMRPVALSVQEGFMTYLKVSLVAGFVLSSPWIFYQIWQFIAAGLYPQERRYVQYYLPFALGLFLGGVFFCFYVVLPFVLRFLLGFTYQIETTPQIQLSHGINFALLLPVMFGLSFQLPLVMLLLERIDVVDEETYRQKRRIAYLIITLLSMVLTPAEPMSMIAMMIPLIVLYEMGIWMCHFAAKRSTPFGQPA